MRTTFEEFKDDNYDAIEQRASAIHTALAVELATKYERDDERAAEIVAEGLTAHHIAVLRSSPADFVTAIKALLRVGAKRMADRDADRAVEDVAARELWEERCDAESAAAERMAERYGIAA
ncbi:MAG: hypothetical protein ACRCTI_04110 [Beijerinckiaceae bacterium]